HVWRGAAGQRQGWDAVRECFFSSRRRHTRSDRDWSSDVCSSDLRPRAPRDRRYAWAYLFGAVCPERAVGAALVLPYADTAATGLHLAEIGRHVTPGAHAVVVLDGAGWHGGGDLAVPENLSLLPLPRYSPELNPVENVWEYLRQNKLSHRV